MIVSSMIITRCDLIKIYLCTCTSSTSLHFIPLAQLALAQLSLANPRSHNSHLPALLALAQFVQLLSYDGYTDSVSLICTFGMSITLLEASVGKELAQEISSMRFQNPAVWTPQLEKYINNAFSMNVLICSQHHVFFPISCLF